MKTNTADSAFSYCVRERAQWICERCGKQYESGSQGLHCAHFQGRGAWATRYEPANCFALCFGCHQLMDSRKGTFAEWFKETRGEDVYNIVLEKSNNVSLAKQARREVQQMTAHFRAQYNAMLQKRAGGVIGWLEFDGWL